MTTRTPLTRADIEAGYQNDEWAGFGYLGDRRRIQESIASGETTDIPSEAIDVADEMVLYHANAQHWSPERFFEWLNSKPGRWAADILIGSTLSASTDGQLRKLMGLR